MIFYSNFQYHFDIFQTHIEISFNTTPIHHSKEISYYYA